MRFLSCRWGKKIIVGSVVALMAATPYAGVLSASADTVPPSGTPATVSADALPTPKVNGMIWATAIYGNTVYATGQFTKATDTNGVVYTRINLLAFNITTGALDTSFSHALTGTGAGAGGACWSTTMKGAAGCALEVSPDGTRLYVGGTFAAADGQTHQNIAAFDLTTNKVIGGFSGTNKQVRAVAATNSRVFFGGGFSTAAGQTHSAVAAYTSTGAIVSSWNTNVRNTALGTNQTGSVAAMTIVAAKGYLVIGGQFNQINGQTYYSNGAVTVSSGTTVHPWGSTSATFPIRDQPFSLSKAATSITSLSNDGSQIYLTSYTFISGSRPATFEGTAAIGATDGSFKWIDDCEGDTYDAIPIGKVLYSVSHAHDCSDIGGYPDTTNPRLPQRILAETTYVTGKNNTRPTAGGYPNYGGQPSTTLLNWFPHLTSGNLSGASQAAWTITGNSSYVALGGEFTAVNGKPQQGLTRFAISSKAPNKVGPTTYVGNHAIAASPATSTGTSTVRVYTTSDMDNGTLTYRVYRHGSSKLLASKSVSSRFWKNTSWTFVDSGVAPGAMAAYDLTVTDPFGNMLRVNSADVVDDTNSAIVYSSSWKSLQNRSYSARDFGRTLHYSGVNGASARYLFYGSAITVIGEKKQNRGTMTITLDGKKYTVSAYAAAPNTYYEQNIFSTSGLSTGKHTITLTKSSGGYIDLDAFAVTSDTAYDDTSTALTYSGKWTSRNSTIYPDYGHTLHYTSTNGATVKLVFNGSSVTLIGEKSQYRGALTITIDGIRYSANAYAATAQYQRTIFTKSGLTRGTHTITVTKNGAKYMDIDALMVR